MKNLEVKFKFNATCGDDLQKSSDNMMIGNITTLNYTEKSRLLILICIQRLLLILHLLQPGCSVVFWENRDLGGYNNFSFY